MLCSKEEEEALVRLFYNNVSSFFFLFLIFTYFSFILLFKFFHFIGNPIFPRYQYEYGYNSFSDEEDEEDEEEEKEEEEQEERYSHVESIERNHLVANIIQGGEKLYFLPKQNSLRSLSVSDEFIDFQESEMEDSDENHDQNITNSVDDHSPQVSEPETADAEEIRGSQTESTSPITLNLRKDHNLVENDKACDEENKGGRNLLGEDEKFLIFGPTELETTKKLKVQEKEDEVIYGDSCTVGSTSKSSSEWRSSINCRDSGTEDPFSSSSRRSCPKWESYTVFQKYDEEMTFLDRISAQKLHETESLRSIEMCPRSVSERIVHKIATMNKKPSDARRHNPYRELEAAYVAQICLTWEALNWNYKNFERKRASRGNFDPGCPGKIAQQFQQFQVLLQRYIENEPYEHGRRPEIYARMRLLAPKLLLVPEYQDSEEDQNDHEGFGSRISSPSFLMIMEDGIRTFMNFLKADREKPCQILASFFKRKKRGLVDPTLLQLMKKVNQKKKIKLKDLRRSRKCLRRRRLKVEEEMEIVMGLIDLKVVSRVLRMADLSEEQLHWCEDKMSKVRVLEGKLHRDSSPLFFPAH